MEMPVAAAWLYVLAQTYRSPIVVAEVMVDRVVNPKNGWIEMPLFTADQVAELLAAMLGNASTANAREIAYQFITAYPKESK